MLWEELLEGVILHITPSSPYLLHNAFKGQVHVFAGRVKIVSHLSCKTSGILKYFCPLLPNAYCAVCETIVHETDIAALIRMLMRLNVYEQDKGKVPFLLIYLLD